MKGMFKLIKTLLLLVLISVQVQVFAVTDKEMEQARTIAAQAYLRYANDGSGYLDDVKASTMSELESKLKAKEKENLKSFKSVNVPSDYASWDKAKLVEFWSITFFTSPNLIEKGKIAKSRVKSRISAMTISDKPAESSESPEVKSTAAEDKTPVQPVADEAVPQSMPTAEEAMEKQEEILADQNAIEQDQNSRETKKESGNTLWYVVLLVILIGCVIWLVSFAAKVMKKQAVQIAEGSEGRIDSDNINKELGKRNRELAEEVERLRSENKRLMAELKSAQASASANRYAPRQEEIVEKAEPVRSKPTERHTSNVIYLGRANAKGLFVRADRRPVEGATVFRLDTRDGLVGTYHVVDTPEVVDMVMSDPERYLYGGCTGTDLDDTEGVDSIVTVNSGTAIFEEGCWKVLRKSRIRYERD